MKAVKIPQNEREFRQFLDNFVDYGKRRGIHVYAILAYSPMVGASMSVIPQLSALPAEDAEKFLRLWYDATMSLKDQVGDALGLDEDEEGENLDY